MPVVPPERTKSKKMPPLGEAIKMYEVNPTQC